MTKNALTPTTVVSRKVDLAVAELDGETVLFDGDSGSYYGYDAMGSRIWALLEEPRTVGDLCDALVERYDVEPARCASEVSAFIGELAGHGLVRCDAGGTDAATS